MASIKPNSPGGANTGLLRLLPGGQLRAEKVTLRYFIQNAFGLKSYQLFGPGWIDSEGYDIEAKAQGNAEAVEMRLMMRSLLEDRFKMRSHFETRELPVYALSMSKGGSKLGARQESDLNPEIDGRPAYRPYI